MHLCVFLHISGGATNKVFILYCKDTTLLASHNVSEDLFCEYALRLAQFLDQCGGIKCDIDQYERLYQHNWDIWLQTKISECVFVVLILSPVLFKELSTGTHTCVEMKNGRFFCDSIVNTVCAPKFVPVFLNGCEPLSGTVSDWLPPRLKMASCFRLQNLCQFINELDPPEGNDMTPEEFSRMMSSKFAESKYEKLAEFVKFLRGEQGVPRLDPPQNPVHIPSPRGSPGPHRHQQIQGL